MGSGIDGNYYHPPQVQALVAHDQELIVGGAFETAGGDVVNYIARWNGASWQRLGAGMNDMVRALTLHKGEVVAGGSFTEVDGVPANCIAVWNGSTWRALGPGVTNSNGPPSVAALTVFNGDLIAAGGFTSAGGVEVRCIASWDGDSWHGLGGGMNDAVDALTVFNRELIATGWFTQAGGAATNRIARWDGSAWHPLGSGLNQRGFALTVFQGELVAGGYLTAAGGVSVNRIARWNGTQWQPVGSGVENGTDGDAVVLNLHVHDNKLIAAGGFATAGGMAASRIAQWDGESWLTLESGVDDLPIALTSFRGELMVGGRFNHAGEHISRHLARWTSTGVPWIAIQPQSVVVSCDDSASFNTVVATGYAPLSYQWRRNGKPLEDGTTPSGSSIVGATTPLLAIDNVQAGDLGSFDVLVSNASGTVLSESAELSQAICGDITQDGVVNIDDLLALIAAWGPCPNLPTTCDADVNHDGVVNIDDLLLVVGNWG